MNDLFSVGILMQEFTKNDLERAMEVIRTPVTDLSVREYLTMKEAKDMYMQLDALDGRYKRKTEADYERVRLHALDEAGKIEDFAERIRFLVKTADEILEGIKMLNYNEAYKECCQVRFVMETTKNMLEDGVSLTNICKYVPGADLYDVYKYGTKYLGVEISVTEDERKIIEEAEENESKKKGVTMADIRKALAAIDERRDSNKE